MVLAATDAVRIPQHLVDRIKQYVNPPVVPPLQQMRVSAKARTEN